MADKRKEWNLTLNVAGEQFYKPGNIDRVPDGPYQCTIADSWQEESSSKNDDGSAKPDNIVFELEVAVGPEKGKKLRRYKSAVEGDAGSAGRKEWKNLLHSVVKDPAQLEGGARNVKNTLFAGKTCYILVTNPPEGTKDAKGRTPFANVNFITKDMMAEFASKVRGNPAANGSKTPGGKTFEVHPGGSATPQPGAEAPDALE